MDKKPLIGVSICAVVLLVLGSLSNVVGYQSVQSSNKQIIREEVNQRELLFQTILDLANNKEIQRTILKSQISRGGFFKPDVRFSALNTPVLTKNQLKQMYLVGLMLTKIISKSKMHSMLEKYQVGNQVVQKEITTVIEKDAALNAEINQLSNSECNCENANTTHWRFPVLCTLLLPILFFSIILLLISMTVYTVLYRVFNLNPDDNPIWFWGYIMAFEVLGSTYWTTAALGVTLDCWWIWAP